MYCDKCGAEIEEGMKFCSNCGTPIADNSAINSAKSAEVNSEKQSIIGTSNNSVLTKPKFSIALIVASGILLITTIISTIVGVTQYKAYKEAYKNQMYYMNTWINMVSNVGIGIEKIELTNENQSGGFMGNITENTKASEVRYLTPIIMIDTLENGEYDIGVRIINSQGKLSTGSTSPRGFTFVYKYKKNGGNVNATVKIPGWGSNDQSIYTPGHWSIEFWYKGVKINQLWFTLK
jgi:hypothetical protein